MSQTSMEDKDSIAEGLRRLFSADEEDDDQDYIPGAGDSVHPRDLDDGSDIRKLMRAISKVAREETSAAAKSRGLLVTSQLAQQLGDDEGAFDAALGAAETSPRLGTAALLLRRRARRIGNVEAVERSLEATLRTATDQGTRIHVARLLASHLARENRTSELEKLLDRAARSGDADDALLLERIVLRLSQGTSLAGVEIPRALAGAVAAVQEILFDQRAQSDGLALPPSPDTALVRAARLLKEGDVPRAIEALRACSLPEDAVTELHAALLATRKESAAESLDLVKALVQKSPSRSLIRELAARAVGSGDEATLRAVLSQADPGTGTFDLEERWFLGACVGDGLALSGDELQALGRTQPALAVALAPSDTPAFAPEIASNEALLAQIGAGLVRLLHGADNSQGHRSGREPLSDEGVTALEALAERGEHSRLVHALRLLQMLARVNKSGIAEHLAALSPEQASGQFLSAVLFAQAGEHERAEAGYRMALGGEIQLRLAAARGLLSLGALDHEQILDQIASSVESPELRLAIAFERARVGQSPVQGIVNALHSHAWTRAESGPVAAGSAPQDSAPQDSASQVSAPQMRAPEAQNPQNAGRAALSLAASVLARSVEQGELAERFLDDALSRPSPVSDLARVDRLWSRTQVPDAATETGHVSNDTEAADFSERLVRRFGYPQVGTMPRAGSDRTDIERLLDFCSALVTRASKDSVALEGESSNWGNLAVELGRACSHLDSAIPDVVLDLQKLLGQVGAVSPVWLERAKQATDEETRRHAYERLAELDESSANRTSAMLWRRTLAEEFPTHVPSLLRLEETGLHLGQPSKLAADGLSKHLPPTDREAYLLVGTLTALTQSDLRSTRAGVEQLLEYDEPSLAALRAGMTVARERRDDELLLRVSERLFDHARTDLDRVAMALGTALVHSRLSSSRPTHPQKGSSEEAVTWTKRALEVRPDAFASHLLLQQLEEPTDLIEKAERLEAFARSARYPGHQTDLWYRAGLVWDEAEDPDRAADCYAETLASRPDHAEAFHRLCEHRRREGATDSLIDLISRRLSLIVVGGKEHLDLELWLAALLTSSGRAEEAKAHLEAALSAHPGHAGALRSHAEVSAALGAHDAAEKSLVALRDRLEDGPEKIEVHRSLGRLYENHLGSMERAMDAYQAVQAALPEEEAIRDDLVRVYCALGLAERATALQTKIIQSTESADKKRSGALRLAQIYEMVGGDPARASATLERTRKAWPLDADVLEATVGFMDRQGTGGSRSFLLDRAGKDARRNLETERLDAGLLDTLGRVSRLSGNPAQAEATDSARAALLGCTGASLTPGGLLALDPKVDDLLAPPNFAAPLRALLRKTGAAMDAAFSVDLGALGARRVEAGPTFERLEQLALALGSQAPELFVSDSLGAKCLPITTEPARLLIGSKLESLSQTDRDFLLVRALKLRWLGAGALARSKDEDRWPMLVALLHLFAPGFRPQSVDGRKAAQARALIEQGLARVGYDDDVPMLALEVIGALGVGGSQTSGTSPISGIGERPRILANRVALLAAGDPAIAISAIAQSEGSSIPAGGPSRFRWIEAREEAKDLILFATTDEYTRARDVLGLVERPAPGSNPLASAPGHGGASAPGHGSTVGALSPPTRSGPPAPPRRPKPPTR